MKIAFCKYIPIKRNLFAASEFQCGASFLQAPQNNPIFTHYGGGYCYNLFNPSTFKKSSIIYNTLDILFCCKNGQISGQNIAYAEKFAKKAKIFLYIKK